MFFPSLVFALLFTARCLTTLTFGATLAKDEVEALESIGRTLGKTNWNFSIDPCIRDKSWWEESATAAYYVNKVECDCSFNNNTICHVIKIELKGQNLSGTLPPELVSLPFLQEIDLTRNYLSGTIPPQWGSMNLVSISLLGNHLTGSIPKELGNISTLVSLVLEHNNFSGNLTAALGYLSSLERLFLNSNNFTGELPETFARLTTLKQFRIGDNNFTGKIPDFVFQNWTNLKELYIVASGLSGPIPSISSLEDLTTIIITDLNGAEASFPQLSNLSKLEKLMLRSCNLIGDIPISLGELTTLKILDLSFNRLTGEIPTALSNLTYLDRLFLTGNMFTGVVPQWIRETPRQMDLSYNNFTSTGVDKCQQNDLNLFASTSRINNSGTVSCLGSLNCSAEPLHFLYINCGGKAETVNGTTYEADLQKTETSRFFQSTSNWAFSGGGVFLSDDRSDDILVSENPQLSMISGGQLYINARHSPSSLTYYAFCLDKATYRVKLHFAEIQFTDGQSYSSFGRRIFDVYIQGKRELKDFNMKEEAGGTGKTIVKSFTVNVSDGILEIHLRWAGKGTTSIPTRGVYGPLVSAISVIDPDYKRRPKSRAGITAAALVGIIAAATLASFLIGGFIWWNGCLRRKSTLERELEGLELHTSSFTLRQIKAATNNFDAANKIGEGGFGPVYKGILPDGTAIAVKQLSARSKQGNREFVTEIGLISALQHPHLVKLYGCCIEGNQLLLIYEYLENNSLARALYGPEEFRLKLNWPTRRKICIGIARGLAYLHEESRLKIVHRDIKPTNVLLDKNLNPKISDFGLAKLDEEDNTHMSTRIAGTYGYMAPEYAMHGHLTDKADVYSFGIVSLEIVRGRCISKNLLNEESLCLLDWARLLKKKGDLLELVDPRIGSDCNVEEAMTMINVALLCTNPTAAARPSMSSVVSMLEGRAVVQEFVANLSISGSDLELFTDSSIYASELNAEGTKNLSGKLNEDDTDNSQTKSMLTDGSWTDFTSASDLYPVNLRSERWQNRD